MFEQRKRVESVLSNASVLCLPVLALALTCKNFWQENPPEELKIKSIIDITGATLIWQAREVIIILWNLLEGNRL